MSDEITSNVVKIFNEDETNFRERKAMNKLEVITGGLPPDANWLSALPEKTVFFVREKKVGTNIPRYMLAQYILVKKFERCVILLSNLNGEQYGAVDPIRFCNDFDLFEIVYDPRTMPAIELPKEEEKTEAKDDNT